MNLLCRRVAALEERLRPPEHLRLECVLPDGTETILTVSEIIASGASWEKVVSGGNMDDLRILLDETRRRAENAIRQETEKEVVHNE